MYKITPQTLALQKASRRRIHRTGGHASSYGGSRGALRLQDRLVPPADSCWRPPHVNGTCEVATIAAQYSTEVQHDQLISPDLAGRWTRVRQRGAGSRCHNRFEGLPGGSLAPHSVTDLGGQVEFGHTGPHEAHCLFHDLRSEFGSVPNPVNFSGILNGAQSIDRAVGSYPTHAFPGRLLQSRPIRETEARRGNGHPN